MESEMRTGKKGLRAYLGLINTLRSFLNHNFVKQLQILTPLTSSVKKYKVEKQHLDAFNEVKKLLTTQDISSNIIGLYTKKIYGHKWRIIFRSFMPEFRKEERRTLHSAKPGPSKSCPSANIWFEIWLYSRTFVSSWRKVTKTELKRLPLDNFDFANYNEQPFCRYTKEQCIDSFDCSIKYAYGCNLSNLAK